MIKRILVGVGTSQTAQTVADYAVELGRQFEAELLGVAVTDPLRLEWTGPRPIGMGVEAVTTELREDRLRRATADVASAKAIFSERCRAENVAHGFSEQVGDPFEIVSQLVRYQDMCVFGLRGLFEHDIVPEPRDALERLVADGVRPILAASAKAILPMGAIGQASAVKLATNIMAAARVAITGTGRLVGRLYNCRWSQHESL